MAWELSRLVLVCLRHKIISLSAMASSCPDWYGSSGSSGCTSSAAGNGQLSHDEADLLRFGEPAQPQQANHAQTNSNDAKNDESWLEALGGGFGRGGGDTSSIASSNISIIPMSLRFGAIDREQRQRACPNTSNAFHHSTSTTAEEYGEVTLDPSAYSSPKPTGSQLGGAAAVGGLAGAVLAGPLVGIAAAAGGAYAATTRGTAGDLTRSTGQAVSNVGQEVKEFNEDHNIAKQAWSGVQQGVQSIQQFEQQHRWGENTTRAAGTMWATAREFEQKNEIGEKTKRGLGQAWQSAKQFERDNKVAENIGKGLVASGRWVGGVISGKSNNSSSGRGG